jgi:hypothetical protein
MSLNNRSIKKNNKYIDIRKIKKYDRLNITGGSNKNGRKTKKKTNGKRRGIKQTKTKHSKHKIISKTSYKNKLRGGADEPEPYGDDDDDDAAANTAAAQALLSGLMLLKPRALKKRALESGVEEKSVADSDDTHDVKGRLIELIMEQELPAGASLTQPAPDPMATPPPADDEDEFEPDLTTMPGAPLPTADGADTGDDAEAEPEPFSEYKAIPTIGPVKGILDEIAKLFKENIKTYNGRGIDNIIDITDNIIEKYIGDVTKRHEKIKEIMTSNITIENINELNTEYGFETGDESVKKLINGFLNNKNTRSDKLHSEIKKIDKSELEKYIYENDGSKYIIFHIKDYVHSNTCEGINSDQIEPLGKYIKLKNFNSLINIPIFIAKIKGDAEVGNSFDYDVINNQQQYERFEFCQREIETEHIYSNSDELNENWILHKGYTNDDKMLIEPPEHTIDRLLNSLNGYINALSSEPGNTPENEIKEKLKGKNLNLYTIYYLSWKPDKNEYDTNPWKISDQTNQDDAEQDISWKIEIENKNATVMNLMGSFTQKPAAVAQAAAQAEATAAGDSTSE